MTYTVILAEDKHGCFHATVPSLPNCNAKARTRNEALSSIREAIANLISRSEIIQLDVSAEPKSVSLIMIRHGNHLAHSKATQSGRSYLMKWSISAKPVKAN